MRKDPLEGMKHHKHKTIRPNPLFTRIVKPLIHLFLQHRYNTEIEDHVGVQNLQAPYFVVGNHVNYWDPFFVSVYLPHDVQWITSDNVDRKSVV